MGWGIYGKIKLVFRKHKLGFKKYRLIIKTNNKELDTEIYLSRVTKEELESTKNDTEYQLKLAEDNIFTLISLSNNIKINRDDEDYILSSRIREVIGELEEYSVKLYQIELVMNSEIIEDN